MDEVKLPGISAFSRRTTHAIERLDQALTQEDVTEAVNTCNWLMDELDIVRDALVGLMRESQECLCPVDSDALGYQHTWSRKKEDCPVHGKHKDLKS